MQFPPFLLLPFIECFVGLEDVLPPQTELCCNRAFSFPTSPSGSVIVVFGNSALSPTDAQYMRDIAVLDPVL